MIGINGFWISCTITLIVLSLSAQGQRQMESLDRGLIALPDEKGGVFLSWRLLGNEPAATGFDLYRAYGEQPAEKINVERLTESTMFFDRNVDLSRNPRYFVRNEALDQSKSVTVWENTFLEIPLRTPEVYRPNDASAGDLTGDGQYELVVHMSGRSRDNSQEGYTDPPILQAYTLEGTLLWEINLGINIREGAHYTQFIVYDLDGDGVAEVSCKTADGSRDGVGRVI